MRLCVPVSKIKSCVCIGPVISKKCGTLLLLFLTVLLFTLTFFVPTQPPSAHRAKTVLIFNNKDLCASNLSVVRSHGRHSMMSETENNQKSVVIVVLSSRKNFMNRNLIRKSWGSIKSANNITILAVVFMLGNLDAPGVQKIEHSKLEAERVQYGDLVMGDFVDTYRNLTRKSIMAYEWLTSFCQEAQIVVKTDDDVMLNIFKLTEELGKWSETELSSTNIWCAVHWNESVVKDPKSVFYASPVDFPEGVFPKHCAGVFYATPAAVIGRILDEISNSFVGRVCTHEDVFMTGIVRQKINLMWQNETIKLIDKNYDWLTYALQTEQGDDAKFLMKVLEQPVNKIKKFSEFRNRFGKKIFYLLNHKAEFKIRFERLWEIIEKKIENKKGDENHH